MLKGPGWILNGSATLLMVAGCAAAFDARAQNTSQASASSSALGGDTLQEVVVTAERRSADLQKTAASVTVINGNDLQEQGRYSLTQILQDIPGVTASPPANTRNGGSYNVVPSDDPAVGIVIRGVPPAPQPIFGSNASTTAYYVDGVYAGVGGDFDINRVEVLRGPQGTLYGRSAATGVVSVHTRDPVLSDFGAAAALEAGSFQRRHVEAAINIPAGQTFAVRVSANQFDQDGLVSSEGTKQKQQEARAKILWQPSDSFNFLLGYVNRVDYSNSGGATQNTLPGQPDKFFVTTGYPIFQTTTRQQQAWAQLTADVGIGDLTYLPSYHTYTTHGSLFGFGGTVQEHRDIPHDIFVTHELRLASHQGAALQWQTGVIAYDNSQRIFLNPVFIVSGAQIFQQTTEKSVRDVGAFAEGTLPFADSWRVTAGLRYDKTRLRVDSTAVVNANQNLPSTADNTVLRGRPEVFQTFTLGGAAGERNYSSVTYKARIEKDLSPRNMLYGMVSTGFLPGDAALRPSNPPYAAPLEEQEVVSYEIGSKNRFLGDKLQINGSVFHYEYEGYQIGVQTNPTQPNTYTVLSAPAKITGVELEASYRLTANDRFDFNFGDTSARFANKPAAFALFVGQQDIPGVVPQSAALSYVRIFPLPGGSSISIRNQFRITSGYDMQALTPTALATGAEPYIQVGTQKFDDLNLSWSSAGGAYSVTGYVNNVFNSSYKQNATLNFPIAAPYSASVVTNFPRFYGVVLKAAF